MSLITKNQCGLIIKSIHLLIVALLGGCTLVPKQDGLNNAESRSTKGFQTRRTETPYPLDPEPLKGQAPEAASSAVGADAAMTAALAGAAIGIGAVLKSPESRKDIQGTCFYGNPQMDKILSPCMHVQVDLLGDGKVVDTTATNEYGRFRFYIPDRQSYLVQVTDRRGRTANPTQAAGRSAVVTIYLKL